MSMEYSLEQVRQYNQVKKIILNCSYVYKDSTLVISNDLLYHALDEIRRDPRIKALLMVGDNVQQILKSGKISENKDFKTNEEDDINQIGFIAESMKMSSKVYSEKSQKLIENQENKKQMCETTN